MSEEKKKKGGGKFYLQLNLEVGKKYVITWLL
jgi:hypothetical protein